MQGKFHEHFIYKMNAILPADIVVQKRLIPVDDDAHCRFDAISREYKYYIYQRKDPFLKGLARIFFLIKLDLENMQEAAEYLRRISKISLHCPSAYAGKAFYLQD